MNGSKDSLKIVKSIANHIKKPNKKKSKVIVCPPYPFLHSFVKYIGGVELGGQNCHHLESGAYTGSISAPMLKSVGCKYVIIGHSERRQYQNENSKDLRLKIETALKYNLKVIYCIGEKINEVKKRKSILKSQINSLPNHINVRNLIIAYEPVWAIGTGKIPLLSDIDKIHLSIRKLLSKKIGNASSLKVSILYGGSVNPLNAAAILNLENVDGALVGGSSLIAKDFCKIIDSY